MKSSLLTPAPMPSSRRGSQAHFLQRRARRAAALRWLVAFSLAGALSVPAAVRTWTGGGADNSWNTAGNWDTGAPVNGDSVVFSGATRVGNTNNISGLVLNGLSFGAGGFTLGGNALTNTGGVADGVGNNTNAIILSLGAAQSFTNVGAAPLVFAGNITNNGYPLLIGGDGTVFLNGILGGTNAASLVPGASLTLDGNGLLRLGGANNFVGGLTLNAGTVQIANGSAIPSGAGRGDVTVNSLATLDLNGNSQTINGLYGDGVVDNQAGTAVYTLTVGNNSSNSAGTFTGTINQTSGTLALNKINTNTFTLNGSAVYTGPTTVSAGTLALGPAAAINSTASITVAPGALLDVSGLTFFLYNGQTLFAGRTTNGGPADVKGGLITSGGTIAPYRPAAAGTLTLSGDLSLQGGTLAFDLGNATTLGSGVNDLIAMNGTLSLGSATVLFNPLSGSFAQGSYLLISNAAANVVGSAAGLTTSLPRGLSATFDATTTPGSLYATMSGVASPATLVWNGAAGASWDVNVSQSWLRGSTPDFFYNLDNAVFNDVGNGSVSVTTGVSPSTTTFGNVATSYTLGGPGAISGSGSLLVNGGGTVTFNLPNNYTGDTFVNDGSVLILGQLTAPPHLTIYSGVAPGNLHLGGGGVYLSDTQNDTYRANFNNLIIERGAGSLAMRNRASSSSYIWQFNSVVRSGAGGTVDFNNVQSKSASPQVGLLITNTATVNGILGGFVTYNLNDWVVPVGTGGGSTAYNAYQTSTSPGAWSSTDNVSLSGSPSAALNTMVVNSLRLPGATTVTINAGQSLTLNSGGLLVPANASGGSTITGGTLLGPTNADLIVHENSALNALKLASVIADNGGASALTKSGQGTLILAGDNTYTGPTFINGPSLQGPNNVGAAVPGTPGKYPAGTLQIGDGGTSGSIAASAGVTNNANLVFNRSDAIVFALPISGRGAVNVLGGSVTLTANNAFAGATTVSGGTLQVGNGGTTGSLGSSPSITDHGQVVFNRSDDVSFNGPISGTGSLTKQGSGRLTLGGANTYLGNTTIEAGTLALGASASLANSAAISVSAGANFDVSAVAGFSLSGAPIGQVLGGNGSVAGNVTVPVGADVAPGGSAAIGTLTLANNLTVNGGALDFDMTGSTSDLLTVNGNLNLTAGTLQLHITGGTLPDGTYRLVQYTGTLVGSVANLAVGGFSQPGHIATLSDATAGEIDLVIVSHTGLNLTWAGTTLKNAWDVNVTDDWLSLGLASVFHQFDNVAFDDSASQPVVNLTATVQPGTVTINSAANNYVFQGPGKISNGAALTKANTSTLTVLTTNDYAGTTEISGGTLQVGDGTTAGRLGAGTIIDNGALVFNQPGDAVLDNDVTGSGTLTQQSPGTLIVSGNSSLSGTTTVSAGVLQVGAGGLAGALGAGPVVNNSALVFKRSGAVTAAGAISGTGPVTNAGIGTLTLSSHNTYAGNTVLVAGTAKLGATEVIPDGVGAGDLVLDGGAAAAGTLDLNGFNETINGLTGVASNVLGQIVNGAPGTTAMLAAGNNDASSTFAGRILDGAGKVTLVKVGAGTLTLNPGGVGSTYSGGTIISNGIVSGGSSTVANANMVGAGPVTFYGGILQLAGFTGSTSPDYGTFANPIVVATNAEATVLGTCRGGGFAPGSVTGPANSTLTFVTRYVRGNFGGNWTAFNGLLVVSNNTASANTDFRLNTALGLPNARVYLAAGGVGGAFVYNLVAGTPIIPIGELSGDTTATIALNSGSAGGQPARWSVGGLNTSAQYDGGITDTHGIIKVGTGTWTLTSGNLTYSGPTIVSNGVLAFSATAAQPPNSVYTLVAPGQLDVSGSGTLTVGNTILGNGTLLGSLAVSGTVMPGFSNAPALLTVTNAATLSGTTLVNLDRTNSPNSGCLAAAAITYGGTLAVTNIGPPLQTGDTFKLFSGTLSGSFTVTNLPALAPGLAWVTTNLNVDGTIRIAGQALPPQLGPIQVHGTTNIISGTGGTAGATYHVLTSTDVAVPLAQWTAVATNTFAADGSFTYTNSTATNATQFYAVVELVP